jgi:septation ring formation regulator EzrA
MEYVSLETFNIKVNSLQNSIDDIRETLTIHTKALLRIENTLNSFRDMYEINKENNIKLATRTHTIENKLGIDTPSELTISGI